MAERFFARAPGKVMLAGEYAVLDGAPAIVMAVDRYAHAVASLDALDDQDGWLTPELEATIAIAREENLVSPGISARVRPGTLFDGERKLGLGSSAAMCVAGLFAAVRASGHDVDAPAVRARCTSAALRGHRRAQGGGSGMDVYASAIGGIFCTSIVDGQATSIEPLRFPDALCWRVLWTGEPVSTKEFVARVRALASASPETYALRMDRLRALSERFRQCLVDNDTRELVTTVRAIGAAMGALGEEAQIPIMTDAMQKLYRTANGQRCAVKPSGAGGGDIMFAVSGDGAAMDALLSECPALGVTALELAVDLHGAVSVADRR